MHRLACLAALLLFSAGAAHAQVSDDVVKIGVLTDLSGPAHRGRGALWSRPALMAHRFPLSAPAGRWWSAAPQAGGRVATLPTETARRTRK